jgi:hypothetical protein
MATAGGPNIERDGLVFGYDTGYGVADNHTATRFFLGKNTSNTWNKNTHSYTSGDITATRNATPPVPPPSEVQGFEVYKLVSNDGGLNQGIMGTSQVVNGVGGNYVHSVYCYLESGTTVTVGQHWHPWAYGSSQTPPLGKWVRLSQAVTNAVDNYGNIANAYRTNGTAYFTAPQYELGSIVSPHVDGTRSSTESLIDLKNKSNIDVSNISFDSSGQPTFDGTDDHITGTLPINGNGAPHTIEMVFSSNVNQGSLGGRRDPFTIGNSSIHQYSALDVNTGYMNWYFYGRDTTFTNSPLMVANKFYHIILSYAGGASNNTNKKVWFNGVQQTLSAGSSETSLLPDNPSFSIGRDRGRNTAYWPGKIPVFKVYNRALSAQEVQQNYNAYKNRFNI